MAAPKKSALPAILLANDLLSGEVVFWSHDRWTRDPAAAAVAEDDAAAGALEHAAATGLARGQVVEAYLVDVTIDASGRAVPNHFRERFKTRGPSIRPDLGKQSEFVAAGER